MNVIAIVGPTGVGKTKLSVDLAKHLNGEVISCDSMQFYKGLDIGTAKVTEDEKQGIKHHLIDILDVSEEYSVAEYQRVVRAKIDELLNKKITPILVGGSGLYIQAVLYDYKFLAKKRTNSIYEDKTLDELVDILKQKSPKVYEVVDLKNKKRVLRALEMTDEDVDLSGKNLYYKNSKIFALSMDRDLLYERINQRVDHMLDNGILKEAKWLYDKHLDTQATKAIGYKEFFPYFKGESTLEECADILKRNSRRYAKRQFTWFKNKMDCIWLDVNLKNFNKTIKNVINYLKIKKH